MNRWTIPLLLVAAACGGDGDDGLANGKPCTEDADCASNFCRFDEVGMTRICATPGGENEVEASDTEDPEDGTSSGGGD